MKAQLGTKNGSNHRKILMKNKQTWNDLYEESTTYTRSGKTFGELPPAPILDEFQERKSTMNAKNIINECIAEGALTEQQINEVENIAKGSLYTRENQILANTLEIDRRYQREVWEEIHEGKSRHDEDSAKRLLKFIKGRANQYLRTKHLARCLTGRNKQRYNGTLAQRKMIEKMHALCVGKEKIEEEKKKFTEQSLLKLKNTLDIKKHNLDWCLMRGLSDE